MARQVRTHDWAKTPLGPLESWPQSLRTTVALALSTRHPKFMAWGPQLVSIFNDAYLPILGAKAAGALGRPFAQLWADVWDQVRPLVDEALSGRGTWSEDMPLVLNRNGFEETAYFTFSYSPIWDETGRAAGLMATLIETTQRVRATRDNARLMAERERRLEQFELLFAQAPGFIAVMQGPQHRFVLTNDAYRQLIGQREHIGKPALEALPEVRGQGFFELLNRVYATGKPFIGHGMRVGLRRIRGGPVEPRHVDFVYQPLVEADGSVSGIFVQGHDVTERHRLLESLQEADRRKDEFLAMLAHELRNPLAPLTNAHRLLERTEVLSERGQQMLGVAQRQTRQLQRLVDDLLEVSRITQGRIELRPEPIDMGATVHAAVESLMHTFEQRSQQVAVVLPARPVRLVADPARIGQILENLLTNASKYTPEAGAIRVELEDRPEDIEIRVIDNGVGIDPAKIPGLFELFSQIDATLDRSEGGLGIGLALVRRLVEMHGGTVEAHSNGLGKGATFTLRLPRTRQP